MRGRIDLRDRTLCGKEVVREEGVPRESNIASKPSGGATVEGSVCHEKGDVAQPPRDPRPERKKAGIGQEDDEQQDADRAARL